MVRKPRDAEDDARNGYELGWSRSQRWNRTYNVPRNSLETDVSDEARLRRSTFPLDVRTSAHAFHSKPATRVNTIELGVGEKNQRQDTEDLSNLSHWLETLSELYMNKLDNRARWDPRWLNITHRERYGGLDSSSITVVDYFADRDEPTAEAIVGKMHLATALQTRPDACKVRVVMISDVSRFVMGAIGQAYSIDPEFWFEYLVNSGYTASDGQLKVSNAVWMNWAERETSFRHRALPGIGQPTEWNLPRRTRGRSWMHMRWGRLGVMHYLGKKGFFEAEIEKRLGGGRWVVERDVALDRYGRLMTKEMLAKAKQAREKKERKQKFASSAPDVDIATPSRVKASNVYRAYSTFQGLPKNVSAWGNRDLRVMAPEGLSYWSGVDHDGKKTIVLLFDPLRKMQNLQTLETIPSLTFMPRPMEIEAYTEEEAWRRAEPEETYLDPPPLPLTSTEIKAQKKEAAKKRIKEKGGKLRHRFQRHKPSIESTRDTESALENESDSSDDDDYVEDYDEEYEKELRAEYDDPKPYARDRDFARKYSLPTHDLMLRYLRTVSSASLAQGESPITSLFTHMILDDFWQLLAELRIDLDRLDSEFSASLYEQLVESIGNLTRQNLSWTRATLQELHEWAAHISASATKFAPQEDLTMELDSLNKEIHALQARAEKTLSLLTASMALSQSSLVIEQTSGINKLTELAFFFVPLSFITSVFSMQVVELTSAPPRIWIWGLSVALVVFTTYLLRTSIRSPSVRVAMLAVRATIMNRFSSTQAGSASHRLNSVSNRAIAKFLFFFTCVMSILLAAMGTIIFLFCLVFGGLWLGAAATALYFIITRWPEPAVLVPCFISLPVAAVGMWISWIWSDEITDMGVEAIEASGRLMRRIFPSRWMLDTAEDEDLAKEGVNIYARQALVMAT